MTVLTAPDRSIPSTAPPAAADWHPADVFAALRKRGRTLAALSIEHGYHATAAGKALRTPWPAMEQIIADALSMPPHAIWPSRYHADGTPRRQSGRRAQQS